MNAHAQSNTPLRCACGHIDITPASPVPLAGVQDRVQPWSRVETALEANALLLEQAGARVLVLTADLLYFGPDLTESVQASAARHGLAADRVVLVASHTHFAPATDRSKPELGRVDDAYLALAAARLDALVNEVCMAPRAEATLEVVRRPTQASVNRRRRWPLPTLTREGFKWGPSIVMAPVPDAPRDDQLDMLRLVDSAGRVQCVVWKLACHPVSFPDGLAVHAEFPGLARRRLREQVGGDIPVLFLQGFTGDVRPNLPGRHHWRDRVHALRRGPGFGDVDMATWQRWADGIAEALGEAARARADRSVVAPLRCEGTSVDLSMLIDAPANPSARAQRMTVRRLAFGSELEILCFGAEVCSPYLALFGAGARTWCVGYTGHVFGYLPSARQADEGGYEGGGFFGRFGLEGGFRPGFETVVVDAVARLRAAATADRR